MNESNSPVYLEQLLPAFKEHGIENVGVSRLHAPTSLPFYQDWLEKGYAGDMQYLHEHLEAKRHPEQLMAQAHSVLSVTVSYFPHPKPKGFPLQASRVALYAQGEDYHFWLKEKLTKVCEKLHELFPEETFKAFVDSAPLLERDYAKESGLGWIGKNSCLINQEKGSLYFLGEILTTMKLVSNVTPAADRCGTCTRCLDICPTGALEQPRILDATKCISYLTIEAKHDPSEELRLQMGDWLFGCDLCQTICPWNARLWKNEMLTSEKLSLDHSRKQLIEELQMILTSSNKKLEKIFHGTAVLRARAKGLKRNAVIVAVNQGLKELKNEIESLSENEHFTSLCQWALKELG